MRNMKRSGLGKHGRGTHVQITVFIPQGRALDAQEPAEANSVRAGQMEERDMCIKGAC